jgi:Flp pilus assembly protein TadD
MPTDAGTVDDLLAAALDAQAQGRRDRAEALLRDAIEAAPDDPDPRQLLGAILVDRGETGEALAHLRHAVELAGPLGTRTMGLYNNYANALRCAQQHEEAEALLRELVTVGPREWQHWHNLAHVLKETKRLDEAAAAIRRAIALAPDHGPNHAVLGSVLHELGRLRAAAAALRRCIALGWDRDVNVWTVLGNTYRYLGELPQAIDALERALELSHGAPSALSNLAITLNQVGRFAEAEALYRRAMELDPDNVLWRNNFGYSQLTAGTLPEAWLNWEYALEYGSRGNERPTGVPRWQPSDTDARVLCYREQGVGDEILFASCLPDLAAAAREVVYEADSRIVSLFARSFPRIEVREQSWNVLQGQTLHDFDRAIPVGSLPMHFRPTVDRFPDRRSFLVADPERVERWRARIAEVAGHRAVVGVSWRSKIRTAERRLEYTHLADWSEPFSVEGVTWVNLQYDDCDRELREARDMFGVTIHKWDDVDYMNDFEEVAALMCVCDLVVAPRNAVAMLAGGLGVPTVMMGNRWDWSDLGTDTSPWFPSVTLVYRRPGEDWDEVLATAARAVAGTVARKGAS